MELKLKNKGFVDGADLIQLEYQAVARRDGIVLMAFGDFFPGAVRLAQERFLVEVKFNICGALHCMGDYHKVAVAGIGEVGYQCLDVSAEVRHLLGKDIF